MDICSNSKLLSKLIEILFALEFKPKLKLVSLVRSLTSKSVSEQRSNDMYVRFVLLYKFAVFNCGA